MKPAFIVRMIFLTMAGLFSGCGGGDAAQGGWPVRSVLYETRPEKVEQRAELVGTLLADEVIEVRSEIAGKIEGIHFREGQVVQAGALLVELDSEKRRAEVARAQASFNLAKANRERSEELLLKQTISKQEYDQTLAQFEVDKAELERVRQLRREALVSAAFDGVLGARLVSPGQYISEGQKITSLVRLNPIKLEIEVPERYLSRLRSGLTIRFSVAAYPEKTFKGQVYFVAPQIDATTRTALVRASVDNKDQLLRPGMFAATDLILKTYLGAITIPESALLLKGATIQVFVVKADQTVELRKVTTGIILPGKVHVVDGLAVGEIVVVQGHQKLHTGSKVAAAPDSDLLSKFEAAVH